MNIKRYFNIKTTLGVETVDELELNDFTTQKAFRLELKRLYKEYRLSGMNVYISNRCTKYWTKK